MVDLAPEWLKEAQGQKRYEHLVTAAEGVAFNLDTAHQLIETFVPSKKNHCWQTPTKEELRKAAKKVEAALDAYRRKIRHFEAELIASSWEVSW